jgi:hypothetical protein
MAISRRLEMLYPLPLLARNGGSRICSNFYGCQGISGLIDLNSTHDPLQKVACRSVIDEDGGSTHIHEASSCGAQLSYLQHQLAAKVPALTDALRFGRLAQGKYTRLWRAHDARRMQI